MRTALPKFCEGFIIPSKDFEPVYMDTYRSGRLKEKVEQAREMLKDCCVCPRSCHANRWEGELGTCAVGRYAEISSYGPHLGEEDCLRGWRGSGTIFFARCNLLCVFCQNFSISHMAEERRKVSAEELARIMLYLQNIGCHNINFVTPSHVVPQLVEAIAIAVERGLRIPIVYNTSAYDTLDALALMDGLVDIYMPDFKFWDEAKSQRYLRVSDYPEVAKQAIKEMHRQVGYLTFDENGIALRGVLLRHLIMPNALDDTKAILHWIATELGMDTYVNLMEQYYPAGLVSRGRYSEINRHITSEEYEQALAYAREVGLWRLDYRWRRIALWW